MENFETPIKHSTYIRAPIYKVFDAITTAEGYDGWFTQGTILDRKVGGEFILKWNNFGPNKVTGEAKCKIIAVEPPHKFIFQWWEDHWTTVEMTFREQEEGTIMDLVETGYANTPEGKERCLGCATGWGEAMTLLKFYVEHGLRY